MVFLIKGNTELHGILRSPWKHYHYIVSINVSQNVLREPRGLVTRFQEFR